MTRPHFLIMAGSLGVAALAVALAAGRSDGPSASLSSWTGVKATVYLRSSFDPRSKPSYTTESGSGGLEIVDHYPTSVQGIITAVESDAIVVRAEQGVIWIPRDQIRILHALQPLAK
jgi:hypothetical protein